MSSFNPKQYWENRLSGKGGVDRVGYIGLGRYYNDWLYRVQRRVFRRHVRCLVNDYSKVDVLDIGSGTGFYVDLWRSLGVRSVTATDIAAAAVEQLQRKFPGVECRQLDIGDALPEGHRSSQYDVISAFAVMYHIIDDNRYEQAFNNVFQMLRPDGFFIFSENFVRGAAVRVEHQVSRPLKDIDTILEKAGFRVRVRVPMFVLMNYPIDAKSTYVKFLWESMLWPVRRCHLLGFFLGAILYPLELMLTSHLPEGPSTELMICEKGRTGVTSQVDA